MLRFDECIVGEMRAKVDVDAVREKRVLYTPRVVCDATVVGKEHDQLQIGSSMTHC